MGIPWEDKIWAEKMALRLRSKGLQNLDQWEGGWYQEIEENS